MSLLLTLILCLLVRPLAIKISLVDNPNKRKTHDFVTPLTGGVCIYFSSLLTLLIFSGTLASNLTTMLASAALMLALGILDDKFNLPPYTKLFCQMAIVLLFLANCNCAVSNLGMSFGFLPPLELGLLSIPFTLLAIVGLTNAINMIDGCDGLASSVVIIALSAVLILENAGLDNSKTLFLLALLFSLVMFVFFNFSKSRNIKCFLGDGGSLFLGFLVAINLVEFAEKNTQYEPTIVLWFVALPIFDFCAVVLRRTLLKRKITAADRSHIHHYLLSTGLSHLHTTILLSASALAFLLFGVIVTKIFPSLSFLLFLLIFISYVSFRLFDVKSR